MPTRTERDLKALQSLEPPHDPAAEGARVGPPVRRRRRFVGPIAVLVVLVAAYLVFESLTAVPVVHAARVLRSSPVADREVTTANGYVVARTRASVASKMQGRLVQVLVEEGEVVQRDQLLAEVEHSEQDAAVAEADARLARIREGVPAREAELREAEAALGTIRASLAERRAAVEEAVAVLREREASFQRQQYLFDKKIAGTAELDLSREARDVARARKNLTDTAFATAESRVFESEAGVEVARQQVRMATHEIGEAEAGLARAEASRDNAFIRSPFAGMVLRREAEPGEVVSPANTGASGSKTAVVTLADFSTLEVEVDVYERDIARVAEESPCRIVLDAYPDRPVAGKVRLLRPTADRTRATIQVYVAFDAVPVEARPEMGARVVFYQPGTDAMAPDELSVPALALISRAGEQGVFVLVGKKLRFRAVEVSPAEGDRLVVRGGLTAGESVVLGPGDELEDGVEVAAEAR